VSQDGRRIELTSTSLLGQVAQSEQVRISPSLSEPDSPRQQRVTIPLRIGHKTIGVLDVYAEGEQPLSEGMVRVLQILADQAAVGLEKAQLFQQTQSSLEELSHLYQTMTGEAWRRFATDQSPLSHYQVGEVEVTTETWRSLFSQARSRGQAVMASLADGDGERYALAVPIKLRGAPIGVLGIVRAGQTGSWGTDEVALGEGLAERMALALENARLLEEAQQRAGRERTIRDISDRVTASFDLDAILHTTLEELSEMVGASGGYAELGVIGDSMNGEEQLSQLAEERAQ
jgi:GAF domain-containing protein